MRTDGAPMVFVPQSFDEIEQGIAWRQLEWFSAGHEESFPPCITIRTLRDGNQRHIGDAKRAQRLLRGIELALPTIDQNQIGPRLVFVLAFEGGRENPAHRAAR